MIHNEFKYTNLSFSIQLDFIVCFNGVVIGVENQNVIFC
jgi:hypothetical protein